MKEFTKSYKRQEGITLVALVITMILHYDEFIKCSNNRRFSFLNI